MVVVADCVSLVCLCNKKLQIWRVTGRIRTNNLKANRPGQMTKRVNKDSSRQSI